jgi:hypothetical protein
MNAIRYITTKVIGYPCVWAYKPGLRKFLRTISSHPRNREQAWMGHLKQLDVIYGHGDDT